MGTLCRAANNECDLPEHCTGDNGQCPADMYKKNASPCGTENGFCYMGECPTLNAQCELIWGYGEYIIIIKLYQILIVYTQTYYIWAHLSEKKSGFYTFRKIVLYLFFNEFLLR